MHKRKGFGRVSSIAVGQTTERKEQIHRAKVGVSLQQSPEWTTVLVPRMKLKGITLQS